MNWMGGCIDALKKCKWLDDWPQSQWLMGCTLARGQ